MPKPEHGADDHRKISEREHTHQDRQLSCEISLLTRELHEILEVMRNGIEWIKSHSQLATKCDLKEMECRIMSAIGDWSAKVGPKLDRIQTGLDTVQALVEQLQNSPGAITPEDQALLDQIEQKVDAIAADADSVPATPPPV